MATSKDKASTITELNQGNARTQTDFEMQLDEQNSTSYEPQGTETTPGEVENDIVSKSWLPYVVANCSSLNFRAAPSKTAEVLQVIPAGTKVMVSPAQWVSDGVSVWMPVSVDNVLGYVMGQYLHALEV